MRIAGIVEESIVDGEGVRFVVFAQGCKHHCKGCHNPETWDFKGGTEMSVDEIFERIKANPLIEGVTFSGGDPIEQAEEFYELALKVKELGLNIWFYTGYTYEKAGWLRKNRPLLEIVDAVVDGPFVEELRNPELKFRGSSNQNIIHINY